MNRNRKKTKVMVPAATAAMAAVIGAYALQPAGSVVKAEIPDREQKEYEEQLLHTAEQLTSDGGSPDITKEEMVYVTAKADGSTKSIIVSDWLKNIQNADRITDATDLKNIKNVKGDETYQQNGQELVWEAKGSDIYYQGETSKKLPLEMKATYYLDGKEISPKELAGKSGTVKIRYEYKNQSVEKKMINGTEEEIYTPFTVITGVVLPTDRFENVTVSNGRVISDGSRAVVVGIAMPGLEQSLGLDDTSLEEVKDKIEIPDSVEITAEVKNFSLDLAVTVATPELLAEMDLDKVEDLEGLEDTIDKAKEAVNTLADGTVQLDDGAADLLDGTNQLNAGSKTLYESTGELASGLETLNEKTGTLVSGMNQLTSRSSEFINGIAALDSGISQVEDGSNTLAAGTSQLKNGAASVNQGANDLKNGLVTAKDGAAQLSDGAARLAAGASQLADGTASLQSGSEKVRDGIAQMNQSYQTLAATVSNDEQLIAALKQVNTAYNDPTIAEIISKLEANTAGQKQLSDGLSKAGGQLSSGAEDLVTGSSQVSDNMQTIAGKSAELAEGSRNLSAGAQQLYDGSSQLTEGTSALYGASEQIEAGAVQLEQGANELKAGSSQLVDGTGVLSAGIQTLSNGGQQLAAGVKQLADGGTKLYAGTETLYTGLRQLADGTLTLKNGTAEMKDGVTTMKGETVDKLSDTYEKEVKDFMERGKAIKESAEDYQTFTTITGNQKGSVKFLIRMEAIGK